MFSLSLQQMDSKSTSKMASCRFLLPLVLLSLFSLSSALPTQTLQDASEILSDSGFVSMALTLNLLSKSLLLQSPSLTIFSPADPAFIEHGQPSLSLLQFHLSPLHLSLQSLETLPHASAIPTFLPNHSLILTSSPSDDFVSLNGIRIDGSPIFDDGSLIIFGIQEFFDPSFGVLTPNPSCVLSVNGDDHSFGEASLVLRSRGYSVMASFLDLQLLGFKAPTAALTLFAPPDDAMKMKGYIGNFSEYPSIFLRHVLPCKLSWADLVASNDGTVLETYLEEFKINVTKSGNNMIMINEVAVTSPDLYYGESIVVHGLQEVLLIPERPQRLTEPPSETGLDHGEF